MLMEKYSSNQVTPMASGTNTKNPFVNQAEKIKKIKNNKGVYKLQDKEEALVKNNKSIDETDFIINGVAGKNMKLTQPIKVHEPNVTLPYQ